MSYKEDQSYDALVRQYPDQYSRRVFPPNPLAGATFEIDQGGLTTKERKALVRLPDGTAYSEVVEAVGDELHIYRTDAEVFDFLDKKTGQRYLFDIRRMLDAIAELRTLFLVGHAYVTFDAYLHFLENGGVEEEHVARLTPRHLEKPVVYIQWPDGEWVLVDGVHRVVKQFRAGIIRQRAIVVVPSAWGQFLLSHDTKMWDQNGQPIARIQ